MKGRRSSSIKYFSFQRLQEELQILRRVYEQHMEKNKEYLEMRYQKKVKGRNKDK